jgi:hypothetical protein
VLWCTNWMRAFLFMASTGTEQLAVSRVRKRIAV